MIRAVFAGLFLSLIAGCATLQGPIKAAETTEQKAAALYGQYVIALELAANVAENPETPTNVVIALDDAASATTPVVNGMLDALLEVNAIVAEFERGETTEERVALVTENLDDWINRAAPVITRLLEAVTAARSD